MALPLESYQNIGTALCVEITVAAGTVWRFSDYNQTITISGNSYQGLGKFVAITTTTSELKTSAGNITITITGIPNTSISEVLNARVKGAKVIVYRVFFDAASGTLLSIAGNPAGRFFGIVDNYTLDEEYDVETRTSSNSIGLVCSSVVQILENKIAGRKTNPTSFKVFNPTDVSMDRVPSLVGANFDFGKPN